MASAVAATGKIEEKSIGIVEMVDREMHEIEIGDMIGPTEAHQSMTVGIEDMVVEILVMQTVGEIGMGMMIGIAIGIEKESLDMTEMHLVEMTILPNNVAAEDWDMTNDHGAIENYHGRGIEVVVVVWGGEGGGDVPVTK